MKPTAAAVISGAVERWIESADAMETLGAELATGLAAGAVLALCGPLGAGKTCLTRGIVAGLGSAAVVTSPTFTLVHEYPGGRLPVSHFDFYRVASADELVAAGWDDHLDRNGVVIVEWADRFPGLMPAQTWWLAIEGRAGGRIVRWRPPGGSEWPAQ